MDRRRAGLFLVVALAAGAAGAADYNVKVLTDGSPDYYDLPSMVRSITSKWPTPKEKCWAMFYWNHIARRQTAPMVLHGTELTDPIRQFNDYGFTMCSTIAGVNQSIWEQMGLKHKFWDITAHTVSEVEYDGRWHMYDNSLSALYTLCDGVTLAGVEDIGKELGCAASGDKVQKGHIGRYHCLCGTSPNGFLSGADCERSLESEGCYVFQPAGLKFRYYYHNWDYGHRYILNLRENEVYTRYYHRLDPIPKDKQPGDPTYYVPNPGEDGKQSFDPEAPNPRYRIRGNGVWSFKPVLTAAEHRKCVHAMKGVAPAEPAGLQPEKAGAPGEAVFRIQSANVTCSLKVRAVFALKAAEDRAALAVSVNNGLAWTDAWKSEAAGEVVADLKLVKEVSGAYEPMIRVTLLGKNAPGDAVLKSIEFETVTMLDSKTQPRLLLGKNTVYVGAGEQTESIVFWPEFQGGRYKPYVAEEKNMASAAKHPGYLGVLYPQKAKEEASVVFRMDAPGDLTKVTYGGQFYHRGAGTFDLLHSFDEGKTWSKTWTLRGGEDKKPWDVIHYETADAPAGARSALLKYTIVAPGAEPGCCSIYAVRMEANYKPADTAFKPLEVTYTWHEVQKDRSRVTRSHAQLVEKLPFRYTINVGGEDHPVMESLRVNLKGAAGDVKYGYSDGKDAGGEKFVGKWVTYGKNLAVGKPYTVSVKPDGGWGGGDPDNKKLTDGVVGPPYAGGTSYKSGAVWNGKRNPVITVDLGAAAACAGFGLNCHGYPFWDSLKGEVQDKIEVLVSEDGQSFKPVGFLKTDLRWKDLPVNHMWPDDETISGLTCRLVPEQPVTARHVQYKVTSERFFCCTELEVLDSIKFEPFDLRLALPDEK